MARLRFRAKNEGDLEGLLEVARALPQWFTQAGLEEMAHDFSLQEGFVATMGERIVGFITYESLAPELGRAELDGSPTGGIRAEAWGRGFCNWRRNGSSLKGSGSWKCRP
jgi:hypothetical protein